MGADRDRVVGMVEKLMGKVPVGLSWSERRFVEDLRRQTEFSADWSPDPQVLSKLEEIWKRVSA